MMLLHIPQYRRWLLLGLLVQLVAAWFSVGYNNPDEHFQVLEFCNYKLGYSSASALPWEFSAHCRAALLPFIAYSVCRLLYIVGLYNPFLAAFILRLGTGLATWLLTCRFVALMLPQLFTEQAKQGYVWCSFLLWFVPYMGVRFSAENIAGLFLLAALSILPNLLAPNITKRTFKLIIAGFLIGFALFIRLQIAFALIAVAAWIICYLNWRVKDWIMIIWPGALAILFCVLADYWLYGTWVISPFNYYNVNVVQHIANNYGVSPWWYYLVLFVNSALPPLSCVLLFLFIAGLFNNPKNLFSWICLVFIIGHSLITHKEIRFLMPLMLPFIFLACKGLDGLIGRYPLKKVYLWISPTLAILNIIPLMIKILIPANEAFSYFSVIYNSAKEHPTTLVYFEQSPYTLVSLEANFFKPAGMKIEAAHSPSELKTILNRSDGRQVLFLNPSIKPVPLIINQQKTLEYCLLPDWISKFNFNNWMSRAHIWSLYRLK